MKKLLLLLIISTLSITGTQAQFAMGDIAFSAYHSDVTAPDDYFTIVLLRAVTAGEEIEFTENGWFAAGGFRVGESTCKLTFGSSYIVGTQIIISKTPFEARDQDNALAGTMSGTALSLATGGDQVFAYNPSNVPSAGNESSFIAAIHMNGDWDAESTSSTTSAKPSVFTDGTNSVSINPEVDNARVALVNCGNFSDIATLRTMLNTSSNWEVNVDAFPEAPIPSICDFRPVLGINDAVLNEKELTIHPNPSNNSYFNIKNNTQQVLNQVRIYDLTGKNILNATINNNELDNRINLSGINSGVYLIKISDKNSSSVTKKLIIQ